MDKITFDLLLIITIFHVSHCQRRIVEGELVTSEKSYVVYLVKATDSVKTYESWLCGGALVSREFIITSAACVEDVRHMFAIAGYRKYVNDRNLENDDCTKEMKKKIVYTCIPLSYEFDFDKIEKWASIDIALAKVESPYNFDDARFELMCSYIPSIIPINYDIKRQATNVDAIVLGWGHMKYWRVHGDHQNYNEEFLRYGSTTLYDKKVCEQAYMDYPGLITIIQKYMICSMASGHLNDFGKPYSLKQLQGRAACVTEKDKSMGLQGVLCEVELTSEQPEQALMNHLVHDGDETRKRMSLTDKSNIKTHINMNGTGFVKGTDNDNGTDNDKGTVIVNGTDVVNGSNIMNATDSANGTDIFNGTDFIHKPGVAKISGYSNRTFTRRNGICQNDHGGPLVTWVGKREVLIGVASVFKITDDNRCIGPFLYTSTMCNGAFLGCLLADRKANVLRGKDTSVNTSMALLCDSPPSVRGFDTIESYVSWIDHPAGPADNEKPLLGRLEPNLKKDRYATKVQEDSEEDVNPLNAKNTQNKIFRNFPVKKLEQNTNDRFSLRIGAAPGVRPPPRKRHLLRKRPAPKRGPPPIIGSPQEMKPQSINSAPPGLAPPPSPIIRPALKMGPSPVIRAPPEMEPLPIIRPEPKTEPPLEISTTPQVEAPAFDEILNFKSDDVIMKNLFETTPSPEANQPRSVVQPEIQIRPQSPLHG